MTEEVKVNYRTRLNASIECVRFILKDGLPCRGSDESEGLRNRGNFIELLKFLCDNNEERVSCTTAVSLKEALEKLFSEHSSSISMLRGQGNDGASNMKALVAVARNHKRVEAIFLLISEIVNLVGASCKRADALRDKQAKKIVDALENEEIISDRGLNQEKTLIRPCDTRWGSHYGTLTILICLFDSAIDVLDDIVEDGLHSTQRFQASRLLEGMQSFEFVFTLYLMKSILGITNELSQALQRRDQDIENAKRLVKLSKIRLQMMRDDGWPILLEEASDFCRKHHISIPDMDDVYVIKGRSAQKSQEILCSHHYRVELFNFGIDMQLQELNNRFNEASTESLLCVAYFDPCNSFAAFDKKILIRLAKFYPKDFSDIECLTLGD